MVDFLTGNETPTWMEAPWLQKWLEYLMVFVPS